MRALTLATALGLVACSRKEPPPPPAPPPPPPPPVASAPAPTPDAGPATPGVLNLLALVPSKIAVSTTVDNPRDFPEHLMDGRLETAWNSKTDDLQGSIYFRVPADAQVERVDITVGFEKRSAELDLFTANHRIKKVAVWRNGTKLRDVALEPEKRGWQALPIGTDGGDFRLEVLETAAGSKKEWRELTVSEMRVVGRPGKERNESSAPLRIAVGGLDGAMPKTLPTESARASLPAKDVSEICAQYIAKETPTWVQWATVAQLFGGPPDPNTRKPFCKPAPFEMTFTGDATWKRIGVVRAGVGPYDGRHLAVELARGWVLLPINWADDGSNMTGCPSVFVRTRVPRVYVENGYLVAMLEGTQETMDGPKWITVQRRGAAWCTDRGTEVTCEEHNPQYQQTLAIQRQNNAWSKDGSKFHVTQAGELVLDNP